MPNEVWRGRQAWTSELDAATHPLSPLGCVAPTGLGVFRCVYTALTCGAINLSPLRGLCYPLSAVGVLTNRIYLPIATGQRLRNHELQPKIKCRMRFGEDANLGQVSRTP